MLTPLRYVLAVFSLVIFSGCGSEPTTAPSSKRIASPAVGSYFVYRAVDYDHNLRENEWTLRMDTHRVIATNSEHFGRKATKLTTLFDTVYYTYAEDGNMERFEENVLDWVPIPVTTKDTLSTYFDLRETKGYEVRYTAEFVGEEQLMVSGSPIDVVKIKYTDYSWSYKGEGLTEFIFYYAPALGVVAHTEAKPWKTGEYLGGNSRLIRFERK